MKLTFTALAVFTAILVRAQFDLSIAITSPTEDYEFDSGATVEVDLDITNWGDIIPEFDTLYLGWVLDGTFYGPNPGAITGASIGGGGVTFPVPGAASFSGLDDGVHTLCAWIIGIGSVELGQNFDLSEVSHLDSIGAVTIADVATGDPTPENNEHCISFIVGDTTVVVVDDASITENGMSDFELYPNPVNDVLTVVGPVDGGTLKVYDLSGALVKETKLVGTQAVDVLDLNPGLYLARIENSTGEVLLNSKITVSR